MYYTRISRQMFTYYFRLKNSLIHFTIFNSISHEHVLLIINVHVVHTCSTPHISFTISDVLIKSTRDMHVSPAYMSMSSNTTFTCYSQVFAMFLVDTSTCTCISTCLGQTACAILPYRSIVYVYRYIALALTTILLTSGRTHLMPVYMYHEYILHVHVHYISYYGTLYIV